MVAMRRHYHPETPTSGTAAGGRLNLLLTSADWQDHSWAEQLPPLLMPLGVHAIRAASSIEAADVIKQATIHLAVIDLDLPFDQADPEPAGERVLKILSRAVAPPPVLVIKRRRTQRDDTRELAAALSTGAFAALDRPVHLEIMLDALRRALTKHYKDQWPNC